MPKNRSWTFVPKREELRKKRDGAGILPSLSPAARVWDAKVKRTRRKHKKGAVDR